jgi:hypothetical protein
MVIPTDAEIAAEVVFIQNDMHWRNANIRKSTTGHPNSANNLKQIALTIRKLMGGKGVTYTNTKEGKTVSLFLGKCIRRNDDLVDLRLAKVRHRVLAGPQTAHPANL